MSLLEELTAAGYQVGIASGCVKTEQDALSAAVAAAQPERVEGDVQTIANQAAADAASIAVARGGANPQAIAKAVAQVTAMALETITVARNEQVAFHERALEIAKTMPTTYVVSGPGFTNLYLDIDDATGEGADESAQAMLASLRDPGLVRERFEWTAKAEASPDGDALNECLRCARAKGWDVAPTLADDGSAHFDLGADGQRSTVIEAANAETLAVAVDDLADLNAG